MSIASSEQLSKMERKVFNFLNVSLSEGNVTGAVGE
jgi:hypothetical protein